MKFPMRSRAASAAELPQPRTMQKSQERRSVIYQLRNVVPAPYDRGVMTVLNQTCIGMAPLSPPSSFMGP